MNVTEKPSTDDSFLNMSNENLYFITILYLKLRIHLQKRKM